MYLLHAWFWYTAVPTLNPKATMRMTLNAFERKNVCFSVVSPLTFDPDLDRDRFIVRLRLTVANSVSSARNAETGSLSFLLVLLPRLEPALLLLRLVLICTIAIS